MNLFARTPLPLGEGPHAARRSVPGSTSFVPAAMGLVVAGEVIRDLAGV